MGIYYYAYEASSNTFFQSPKNVKGKNVMSPSNPFGQMLMKNMRGGKYEVVDDWNWYRPDDCKDITEQVWSEYLLEFPQAIDLMTEEK